MRSSNSQRPLVLEVWLHGRRAGSMTHLAYDRNHFAFDEEYAGDRARPVLSLSFLDANRELMVQPQVTQTRVPPFFSNLLPEGPLREYLARRGGVKEVREFFLLWLLGADLPGAVVVRDLDGRPIPPASETRRDGSGEGLRGGPMRFSLAGVQLKFSAVGGPDGQLSIPAEGLDGHWIVKLPSVRFPNVPENEYSMMTLARAVGIEVAEAGLIPTREIAGLPPECGEMGDASLYVRRFDRAPEGGRIHMEDFNQIYGQFSHEKYSNYSYTNMAADIWRVLGEEDLKEFVRRLVFNAAIGNADMHLKNWSVIYRDGRTPRLAPGYDFVSTIQYIEDRTLGLSMAKVKDMGKLDEDLLLRFATRARVPAALVRETALETAARVVQCWAALAPDLPLGREARGKITDRMKLVPLTRQFLP